MRGVIYRPAFVSGETVIGVDVEYAESQSASVAPETGWSTTAPVWREGYYIWQRTVTQTVDGDTVSDPTCISGRDGVDGTNGGSVSIQSISKVDGVTTVTLLDSDGTTKTLTIDDGDAGADAVNSATVTIYKRSETLPAVPSGSFTYRFNPPSMSGTWENWTLWIPDGDAPCWGTAVAVASAESSVTINSSDWATPTKLAENGHRGLSSATVYLYRRAASAPAAISDTLTYTFADGALSALPTGWTRSVPMGDEPCWVTQVLAIGNTATVTLAAADWTTPVKLVENGISVSAEQELYALGASATTAPADGDFDDEVKTPTAALPYLWNYERVTYSNGVTINRPKHLVAMYGATGSTGVGVSGITEYYADSATADAPADSAFTTSAIVPSAQRRYLWNYELITYTDGTTERTPKHIIGVYGDPGAAGADGLSITNIAEQYNLSTSAQAPDGTWSDAQPEWSAGHYIWTRSVLTWSDGTSSTTTPVLASAINGANEAASDAGAAVSALDRGLTRAEILSRLTNGGQDEALYVQDGHLYINGTYIHAGEIAAELLTTGRISSADGTSYFDLDTGLVHSENVEFRGSIRTVPPDQVVDYQYLALEDGNIHFYNGQSFDGYTISFNGGTTSDSIVFGANTGENPPYVIINGRTYMPQSPTESFTPYIRIGSPTIVINGKPITLSSGSDLAIRASGVTLNGDTLPSGTYTLLDGTSITVDKGFLKSIVTGSAPVPIPNGGTGLTASPSMLINLASSSAADVFQASPRPGVLGVLPASHGGTGLTASPSMLTNLGSTSAANVMQASPRPGVTGTLPIGCGGTGATTAAAARTALGITPANIGAAVQQQLSGVELDDLTTPGIYYVMGATCATSGETGFSGNIIVSSDGGTRVVQIRVGAAGTALLWRSKSGSPAAWNAWQYVTERRATYNITVDVTGATIGARCHSQSFTLPDGVTRDNIRAIYTSKNTASGAANVNYSIGTDGKLYVSVYAAQATVSAEITVTVVY